MGPLVLTFRNVRPTYRTAYKLPLGTSFLHLGQPQPQPFNPLIPNELRRRCAVRPLKIKIPSKNLGRQRCTEGFNFVAKRLNQPQYKLPKQVKPTTVQVTKTTLQDM